MDDDLNGLDGQAAAEPVHRARVSHTEATGPQMDVFALNVFAGHAADEPVQKD